MKTRLSAVFFLSFILFTGVASATVDSSNWDMDTLNQPYSFQEVSNQSSVYQIVNLTTNSGDPINESMLTDSSRVEFKYNSTTDELVWLDKGYWYVGFMLNNATDGTIEFEAEGETSSSLYEDSPPGTEVNATRAFDVGNMSLEIGIDEPGNDFTQKQTAGDEVTIEVNVTDEWNNENEDSATVDLYFTNGTWTSSIFGLGYNEGLYTNTINLPSGANSTYIVHANSSASGYNEAFGTESALLQTYPAVESEISSVNSSSGCDSLSWVSECENQASIQTGVEITADSAEQVNLTVNLVDKDTGEWHVKKWKELSQNGSMFTGEVTLPDINTSTYEKKYVLRYNASKQDRDSINTYNISYRSFEIDDDSASTAYQGTEYDVKIVFERPFSFEALNASRFRNATVELEKPDNSVLVNFSLSDMTYKDISGLFKKTVDIPGDATTEGSYSTNVEAFNIYGEMKTYSDGFNVKNSTETFNTSGDLEMDIERTGTHKVNVTLWNKVDSQRTISHEIGGGIQNFTAVNGGEDVTLPGSGQEEVAVEFNISYAEDKSGYIIWNDTDAQYDKTIQVELDGPSCDNRDNELCLHEEGWVNVTQDDFNGTSSFLELEYFGEKNSSVSVDTEVMGDLSSYLSINSSFELEDSRTLELEYNATTNGTYTGNVSFAGGGDMVWIWSALESNAEKGESDGQNQTEDNQTEDNQTEEEVETGIDVATSLDIGSYTSGETVVETIDVTNTGGAEITDVSFSSDTFTVFSDLSSVDAGSTETASLTFQTIDSESGTVEVTGMSDGEEVSDTVDISGTLETSGDAGGEEEETDDTDTGGTTTETPSQDSGGGSILPLAAGLFVVLLIGFVAYSSIELEEGDPMYDLLGE